MADLVSGSKDIIKGLSVGMPVHVCNIEYKMFKESEGHPLLVHEIDTAFHQSFTVWDTLTLEKYEVTLEDLESPWTTAYVLGNVLVLD